MSYCQGQYNSHNAQHAVQISGPHVSHGQDQVHNMTLSRSVQPPTGLDLGTQSLDRKDVAGRSEYRTSMTNKIMTNGSLTMLNSPTNPNKDFQYGFQMRKCGSNSSNSEEESICGSSEDTGTIKRRPNSNQGASISERPMSPRTTPRSPLTVQLSKYNSIASSVLKSDQSQALTHNGSPKPTNHVISSTTLTFSHSQSPNTVQSPKILQNNNNNNNNIDNEFAKIFKIEPLRLTSVDFHDRKVSENGERVSPGSGHSEPECDLQLEDSTCELQVHEPVTSAGYRDREQHAVGSSSSSSPREQRHSNNDSFGSSRNSEPESSFAIGASAGYKPKHVKNTDHHDYVNIPINPEKYADHVRYAHLAEQQTKYMENGQGKYAEHGHSNSGSTSSSTASTVCAPSYNGFVTNILSTGSPRSSLSGSKSSSMENVTPMNSDTEFLLPRQQGSRASSTATTDSSECSWGTVDVSLMFSFFCYDQNLGGDSCALKVSN